MSSRDEVDSDAKKARNGDVDAFLRLALKRFKFAADAWSTVRTKMLADKKFLAGEQWEPAIRAERKSQDLPCLTIDMIKPPKRQIMNSLMAARPGIQISPIDSGADLQTAAAIQGLVRNVERQSHAEVVYSTAADDAVTMGLGFWRVNTPYAYDDQPDPEHPESFFQQEIKLLRVRNPFTIYPDPRCQEIDYRDADFYFVVEDMPVDEYRETYPDSKACDSAQWQGVGDDKPEWLNEKTIRVVEYWHVETIATTHALLRVPSAPDPDTKVTPPPMLVVWEKPKGRVWADGVEELDTRVVLKRQVRWAKINALEVLEGNDKKTGGRDWAGRWIPIVPCLGEETDIGGKVDLRGLVRDAKDAQLVQNYEASALIEKEMLASKAPYIMAAGQEEGYENQWKVANTKRMPFLLYNPIAHAGTLVGAPQRNNVEPAIQATMVGIQQSEHWIMSSTGYHQPSLGQQGPQESGRAIMARQRQGEIGSSNYAINLSHAIRFTGEILVDLIPHIYDAPRIVRILGPDDQEQKVAFHNGGSKDDLKSLQQQGIAKIYDVSVGRYDVAVSTGTSKDTQRQEEAEMLTAAVQANPQLMQTHADLYFETLDTPIARKMAERSKKLLPEHLQDQQDGQADPARLQAQIKQMQAQMQQMQQAGQQMQQVIQTKQVEAQTKAQADVAMSQAELDTKERLAHLEADTKVKIAEIQANSALIELQVKANADQSQARLEASLRAIEQHIGYQQGEAAAGRNDARADAKEIRDREAAAAAEEAAAELS